jgi:hypothetical protein
MESEWWDDALGTSTQVLSDACDSILDVYAEIRFDALRYRATHLYAQQNVSTNGSSQGSIAKEEDFVKSISKAPHVSLLPSSFATAVTWNAPELAPPPYPSKPTEVTSMWQQYNTDYSVRIQMGGTKARAVAHSFQRSRGEAAVAAAVNMNAGNNISTNPALPSTAAANTAESRASLQIQPSSVLPQETWF